MVFEILTFDFYLEKKRQLKTTVYMNLSRGKKATVNYCLYECKHIIMKK